MKISLPAAEIGPPPAFHQYTEDTFDGVLWRWRWSADAAEPSPPSIVGLTGYCVKCGLGLHASAENWLETFSGQVVEAGRGKSYSEPVFAKSGCRYHCQVCQKRWFGALFDGSCKDGPIKIKRLIERGARERMSKGS